MDEKERNKKFRTKYFINLAMMIVFIAALLLMMGYAHESAHAVIYSYYGLDSQIHLFKDFPDMTTQAEGPCPVEACRAMQSVVDAVGYHLIAMTGIFLLIWGISHMRGMVKREIDDIKFEAHLKWQQEIVRVASQ